MKVAEMCRKLETEEEKVLPFYASSLTKEEQEDVDAAVLEQPTEPIANVCYFVVVFFLLKEVGSTSIATDKALFSSEKCWYLSYFSMKTYVVGTH